MTIPPTKSTELLSQWVQQKHAGQLKKYTEEPYFNHVLAVAEMAGPITVMGYEIGLCHDLLEDTNTTKNQLFETLLQFGYGDMEANYITVRVVELTDVYTSAAYPAMSREERKEQEALRLQTISSGAQTVKYCDLLYNMDIVVKYDKPNAITYLLKKKFLLTGMVNGNAGMRQKAIDFIADSLKTL